MVVNRARLTPTRRTERESVMAQAVGRPVTTAPCFPWQLGLAAHAGRCSEELDGGAAAPSPLSTEMEFAGDAGLRTGEQALLADQRVDQRRPAGVRGRPGMTAMRIGSVPSVSKPDVGIGDVLADQRAVALTAGKVFVLVGLEGALLRRGRR